MEKLYDYLKLKLKQKDILLDQFAHMCGFSKSTLYRYMKGILIMPEAVENKIASLLEFTDEEKEKLNKFVYKAYVENAILNSNHTLYKYIFDIDMGNKDSDNFELVFYEGNRYISSINEIFDEIISMSSAKNFLCEVSIIGCIDDKFIKVIHSFINNKNVNSSKFKIEHIVNISQYNYNDTLQTFKAIFPIMKFYGYNIYYTSFDSKSMYLSIVNDCLIIKYSFCESNNKKVEKYFFINFIKDRFSGCYISKDINLYNFIMQNYASLKQNCIRSSVKINNLNSLIDKCKIKDKNIYLFQSTPSYDKIPIEVLEDELSKYSDEEITNLVNVISSKNNNLQMAKEYIKNLKKLITEATDCTKVNKHIDMYTKEGIKNFISTGYLYFYNKKLKPFSKSSICKIFNYMLERSLNPNDNYKMYISNDSINDKLILKIIQNQGITVTYNFSSEKNMIVSYSVIENESIYKIFSNFAENYIPTANIMSDEEAYNYIQGLLKAYC